jgi:pyruvate dehydrogenase E2 component (dihydrolipoamide acetyltransferase)
VATEVIMPALGVAQETGKLLRWIRTEGERVERGAPIMEIETDKVTVDVEAPASGTLAGVRVSEGVDVPVGHVVAVILAPGEELPAELPEPVTAPAAAGANGGATALPAGDVADLRRAPSRRPLASPKARRLAAERGIDLAALAGSGPRGAIVAADVESVRAPRGDAGRHTDVGSVWRLMAERTTQAWQAAPHFYVSREVDATRLEAWRASARRRAGYEGVTHTDLLVKLVAHVLREHPRVNGTWRDNDVVEHEDINVGIAVAVDDGLVVPVVHGADRLELREVAARRAEVVDRARNGRLRPDDVAGGTFTISNLGMFGVDAFSAIVNAPQAAILAVGRIVERVIAIDGRPEVRPMCILTLSFDHRVVDGARGARFLETLAELVAEPTGLVS